MTDGRTPGAPASTSDTANLMNLGRVAKIVALLCFLLPWVTISCAGRPLVQASGLDMASGTVRPLASPFDLPGADSNSPTLPRLMQDASPDIFVLIAAILIVAGLVASFALPRRRGALVAAIGAALAAALIAYDVLLRIKGGLARTLRESGDAAEALRSGGRAAREMQQFIAVEASTGFWLTLAALIAAAALFKTARGRSGYSGDDR